MSIQVTPIPRLTVLTVPAFTLGTANAAGSASTAIASDSTLLAFDTTVPSTNTTWSQSSAAGSAVVASRRDHVHGMPADPVLVSNIITVTRTAGAGAGDQTITGFGFDPNTAQFISGSTTPSKWGAYGWADDDADDKSWTVTESAINWSLPGNVVNYDAGTSNGMAATFKEFTSDGLIITWSKIGAGVDMTVAVLGLR